MVSESPSYQQDGPLPVRHAARRTRIEKEFRISLHEISGFSAGGSVAMAGNSAVQYATYGGKTGAYYKTYFQYYEYKTTCPGFPSLTSYSARPYTYAGGSSSGTVPTISATWCVPFAPYTDHYESATTAVTWSNGVALKGATVDIDVSAKTGYTTAAELSFHNGTRYGAHLCGTGGYPSSPVQPPYRVQSEP